MILLNGALIEMTGDGEQVPASPVLRLWLSPIFWGNAAVGGVCGGVRRSVWLCEALVSLLSLLGGVTCSFLSQKEKGADTSISASSILLQIQSEDGNFQVI